MKECEDYGLSNCGAYFISRSKATSVLAANTYRALITGDGSSVEKSAVNTWEKGDERTAAIRDYLRHFYQPVFARLWDEAGNYMPFSAGTMVSGLELPLHMGLPISSVSGVTVAEHAAFGRNLADKPFGLPLGELYHMGGAEGTAVMLDPNSLTAHTFITGSTGAGKSNTIYHMLDELKGRAKFLVIEPAKGEYKNVFGHLSDVAVYGTNPGLSPMLRINPFSFPEGVHVYEHIDRLVEIFNACWPMYAAMPAVLKESIERAYIAAGWDMRGSVSRYGMFPCFADVLEKVSEVIGESNYSADTKGDYIGALSMRLRSLTNGINSLIFTPDELPEGRVFDENVIIDLSRVGSTETKALIMGVLIMKLQEHRMSTASASNEALRHVTVLEEAHTLLRRTSAEQTTDGANLLGKAVEMLANSIAEMRTYGEGFIIADQSPGLLDMSVIRNTNTKIILRLPDFSDRELVGKAAGLNDDQIVELAKLERGVAAVYQNDWLEAVLCRVSKSGLDESPYRPQLDAAPDKNEITGELIRYLILPDSEKLKYSPERLRALERGLAGLNTPARVKADVLSFIKERRPKRMDALRRRIIYSLFNTTAAFDLARPEIGNLDGWRERMLHSLVPDINHFSADEQERILARLLFEQTLLEKNAETEALCKKVFSGLKNR
ncbi:MAG: ATP-binding protein [Oscillospiraceae bacterium]|nr:ATP-binding protein [Oscillospiraceae bacterium]